MEPILSGTIFDIRRYSVHDGPGIRTTVFFKGCPLRCQWCHNPEGQTGRVELMYRSARCIRCGTCVEICPKGAVNRVEGEVRIDRELCDLCGECVENCYAEALELAGYRMHAAEVMAELRRDQAFYDESHGGVTFSGGEPMLQYPFLVEVLQECKQLNIRTAVDTCGDAAWEAFETVRPYTDLFLYDIKIMDPKRHLEFTGASNKRILTNLRRLSELGHRIIVRIPVIPGVNDDDENFLSTGEYLADLPNLEMVELLPYHSAGKGKYTGLDKAYELPEVKTPPSERMEALRQLLREFGLRVV